MTPNPIEDQIDRLFAALDAGARIDDVMREDERQAGRRIVRPGDEPWLPVTDWDPTVVVSVDGLQVRLVAILAKNPGNGALRRLVAAILAARLVPVIVCPTNEMRATVKRWHWRQRHIGAGWKSEEIWFPRRAALASAK